MSRFKYLAKRLLLSIPVVLFGTTITFVILRLGPISPAAAIAGKRGKRADYQQIKDRLGLDEPLWEQYIDFIFELFTLQFGKSWVIQPGQPAWELLGQYAPRTIWLGFWSVIIALFIGIPLGFYAGLHPNSWSDYFASFGGIIWRAMPNFWLAVILVSILSQSQQLFGFEWQNWIVETQILTPPVLTFFNKPLHAFTNPWEWWIHPGNDGSFLAALKMIAPAALVLGSASMGNEMRIGRTAILETKNSNYVDTAIAKGVSDRALIWKHMFRNAMIPLVPIITGEAFLLIGGSVLVETVFGINGLGFLFFQAVINGDFPLVGSLVFVFIVLLVTINIIQDILYTLIDPRVGYEGDPR
ncbi:MAG: ABC transporter permease [Halobacteriaceae archaeon]